VLYLGDSHLDTVLFRNDSIITGYLEVPVSLFHAFKPTPSVSRCQVTLLPPPPPPPPPLQCAVLSFTISIFHYHSAHLKKTPDPDNYGRCTVIVRVCRTWISQLQKIYAFLYGILPSLVFLNIGIAQAKCQCSQNSVFSAWRMDTTPTGIFLSCEITMLSDRFLQEFWLCNLLFYFYIS